MRIVIQRTAFVDNQNVYTMQLEMTHESIAEAVSEQMRVECHEEFMRLAHVGSEG